MSKIKIVIVMLAAVFALSLSSCSKNKCEEATQDVIAAEEKYFDADERTKADCEAYKQAVKDAAKKCNAKGADLFYMLEDAESMNCDGLD
jgi:hypothetical protein